MRLWQLGLGGALLTGLALVAAAPDLNLAFLAPVALCPLLYALAHEPRWRQRALWGWLAGVVQWGGMCYWVRDVLAGYGGLDLPLSWLALALFAAAKALHLAVFAVLAGLVLRRWYAIPAVAALWTGIERLHAPLGFTWLLLGNAGIEMPLPLRAAPIAGVYGLSFAFAALAAGLTLVALRRGRRELLWLAPLAALYFLPPVRVPAAPAQEAVSLQPALRDDMDWSDIARARTLRQLSLATLESALTPDRKQPALLLWPEAPAPFYFYRDPAFRDQMTQIARLAQAPFIFGTVAHTPGGAPLNSAVLLDAAGKPAGRYDKIELVPFGEYVPPGFGWIEKISTEAGNYAPGERLLAFPAGAGSIGVFICYESAFGAHVRQLTALGAQALVSLTNDGYFGSTAARRQHLLLARMRAVENRRWVLRSANDGTTAAIDPAGRLWDRAPEAQRATVRLRFGWIRERTPYTNYGDWFAWLALAVGLAACLATQFPAHRPSE